MKVSLYRETEIRENSSDPMKNSRYKCDGNQTEMDVYLLDKPSSRGREMYISILNVTYC